MPSKLTKTPHTMPDKRTVKAWAVGHVDGDGPFLMSIALTRKLAIEKFTFHGRAVWEVRRKLGYRVRRVEISWSEE